MLDMQLVWDAQKRRPLKDGRARSMRYYSADVGTTKKLVSHARSHARLHTTKHTYDQYIRLVRFLPMDNIFILYVDASLVRKHKRVRDAGVVCV